MSKLPPHLPPEVIDSIIDFLLCPREFKVCCLVSKSWVPCARKHLFREAWFHDLKALRAWKRTFPDPDKSPAHLVRSLVVGFAHVGTMEDDCWIQSFTNVVQLRVCATARANRSRSNGPFSPLRVLSSVKSLLVESGLPLSEVLKLIHSFPLLQDLRFMPGVGAEINDIDWDAFRPFTLPPLTGALELKCQVNRAARLLLGLPCGLRFRKITLAMFHPPEVEFGLVRALVEKCSGTLESICIEFKTNSESRVHLAPVTGSVSEADIYSH
jgi:hypothetical protein